MRCCTQVRAGQGKVLGLRSVHEQSWRVWGFLLRRSSGTVHHVSKLSFGLYPVSAGNKNHDLEMRQEGIKGIKLLLALSFLYRLHYTLQCIISNAECL